VYRERQLITVTDLDSWNELVTITEEVNELCASKGWTRGMLLTRTVGRFNELCLERDYPDLETMVRERKEMDAEPALAPYAKRLDALRTEDTGYSELWEEALSVPL